MPDVRLGLFGVPRLDVGGQPVSLGRRKAMALLAYLAVTRNPHHRETLATLLWPESSPEAAYSALRNVLWILRQTPLAPYLHSNRSTVELMEDDAFWVDANRFRELATHCPTGRHPATEACVDCAPSLVEAVGLFHAPFMAGFMLDNADGFDDWQFAERDALHRELSDTLDRLTALCIATDDWAAVAIHSRRWLDIDRLNEFAYQRLIEALAKLGKRSEALRCYEACVKLFDEELGLPPESATTDLANSIRRTSVSRTEGAVSVRLTNLPTALTPFVGRANAVEHVVLQFLEHGKRLVSLVGLSGVGKTALALEIGRTVQDKMEHGVFLVALGTVDKDEMVIRSIAEVLGLSASRDRPAGLSLELADFLREREMLLILDETERVPSMGAVVSGLLSNAPRVRCLVTSHAPLGISGEVAIPLHGLDIPPTDAPIESLGEYDAIRLLKLTERSLDSMETVRDEERLAMASVARLLEGFPLGLEMAGAWRSVFSWREIHDRISDSLDFLVHTHRDVPERHRNLRAVYEQAWNLLSQEERTVLCRLAVFRGGFGIGDAESATGGSPEVFAALAERCLIRRIAAERYQVHELLRQFSLKNLRATSADYEQAMQRHAIHFIERAATSFERLKGTEQIRTLYEMQLDLANIRAAWLYVADASDAERLRQAAHGLFFYFDMRAHFEEGSDIFRRAIDRFDGSVDASVDGFLRIAYGWFARFTAEVEPDYWIREGLRLLDGAQPFRVGHALANVIAGYAGSLADIGDIRERLHKSLAYFRGAGDTWGEALTIDCLAGVEFKIDADHGKRLAEESLRLRKRIGDHWGEALNLSTLARFAEMQEDWELAKVRYHQSQRLSVRIADDLFMAIDAQISRARIALEQGAHGEAEELANDALSLAKRTSSRLLIARAVLVLGRLARARGDSALATERLEACFAMLEDTPWRATAAGCAEALASIAQASGDERSARGWQEEARTLDPENAGGGWND